jgi:hypothetical protein
VELDYTRFEESTRVIVALILLLCIGLGVAAWALGPSRILLAGGVDRDERWPLAARSVMTAREQELFRMLAELYPDHVVLAHVALSQFIDVTPGTSGRSGWRNRFSQLVADFVLCTKDFSIVAVIELDDLSPLGTDRRASDARKAFAVASAGLRLARIAAGPLPAPPELRRLVELTETAAAAPPSAPSGAALPAAHPDALAAAPRPMRRSAAAAGFLGAVVVALAVVGARLLYTRAHPVISVDSAARSAGAAERPAVPLGPALGPASGPAVPPAVSLAEIPVVEDPEQAQRTRAAAERAAVAQQAAVAQEKRKERAWAEFYKADDSCEHPSDWAEQVECGNQYIRARKAFDKLWQSQQGRPGVQSLGQNRSP